MGVHLRRFWLALAVPPLLVVGGTAGYHLIEGWPPFDCLYMTVITLTTVGFGEVHPLSTAGRAFTVALVLGGVFTLFYTATELIRATVSGELRSALGRQRMERDLGTLRDHVVVCGFGRMGRLVCREFSQLKVPFVVIDRDEHALVDFAAEGGVALHGDATDDAVLRRAGVERARALVTVLASDADNLYVTMSAKFLAEKLFVVARAESDAAETKLLRAGAARVVSPYVIGGERVAHAVVRPAVVDFIELATRTQHLELNLEEALVAAGSALVGCALRDCALRELSVIVVAIKKPAGGMAFKPDATTVLEVGDTLILLGSRLALDRVAELARG